VNPSTRLVYSTLVCSTLLLLGSAAHAQAASILFEDLDLTGGDITAASLGPNALVTGLVDVPFDTLVVNGGTEYHPLFEQENFNTTTEVLTLVGSISALPGLAAQSTLVSIQFSAELTGDATSTNFALNEPLPSTVTSITVSPVLLADLGLTGTTFSLSALTAVGNAVGSDLSNYVVINNASIDLVSPTPEPGSWLLMMMGLSLIAFSSLKTFRKKSSSGI
jgi:hypothetical protein